jgi:hypothetical protein
LTLRLNCMLRQCFHSLRNTNVDHVLLLFPQPVLATDVFWILQCNAVGVNIKKIAILVRRLDRNSHLNDGVNRDSVVGVATRYELDGTGIESRWRRIFRTRPYRPWDPPHLLYNGYRVSLEGVYLPGRGVHHPLPSSAEAKERVELYLYSPSGPSWPVLGRTLPFTFLLIQFLKQK